jgi:molybdenum cofactor synthesis domain-containing protein
VSRRALVLTVSDSVSAGVREDLSGPAVVERLRGLGWETDAQVLPDDLDTLASSLADLADSGIYSLILTTGGTGLSERDVTPEATGAVIEREVPGLAEWIRLSGRQHTERAILSRGVAGVRGRVLIVNLPGSPGGAVESLECISSVIPHACDLLAGQTSHEAAAETGRERSTSQQ